MVIFQHNLYQSDSDGSVSSGESIPHGLAAPCIECMWDGCGYWFSQLDHLASHVAHVHAVPGKGGLFYCGWKGCTRGDRGFNARYKMLVHVRTHTNERPHLCFKCNKTFSRAENLKIHSRTHTGEKPYVCSVAGCGKAYSNSSDRFKHMRTHSVGKPYVCKVPGCPKKYTDPSSLRKHLKTYRHAPVSEQTTTPIPPPVTELCKMEEVCDENPAVVTSFSSSQPPHQPQEQSINYPPVPPPVLPVWPSFVHFWAITPPQVFCLEQDKPLDLTCPLKIENRV